MEGTKIKESGKRRGEKNYRKCFFSGLEKPGKECVDIGMEDFCKGNKFRYLDVHTVGFQLGIGTFGHGEDQTRHGYRQKYPSHPLSK